MAMTTRNTCVDPKRCTSFAPSMTKPATASEYITMPVAMVVGGTPKLATMPDSETGSAATLKDISICPSAMAIIGTQDSRASAVAVLLIFRCPPSVAWMRLRLSAERRRD